MGGLAVKERQHQRDDVQHRQAHQCRLPAGVFVQGQHTAPAGNEADRAAGHLQRIAQSALGWAQQPGGEAVGRHVLAGGEERHGQTALHQAGPGQGEGGMGRSPRAACTAQCCGSLIHVSRCTGRAGSQLRRHTTDLQLRHGPERDDQRGLHQYQPAAVVPPAAEAVAVHQRCPQELERRCHAEQVDEAQVCQLCAVAPQDAGKRHEEETERHALADVGAAEQGPFVAGEGGRGGCRHGGRRLAVVARRGVHAGRIGTGQEGGIVRIRPATRQGAGLPAEGTGTGVSGHPYAERWLHRGSAYTMPGYPKRPG